MRISDWSSDVCSSDLRSFLADSRLLQQDARYMPRPRAMHGGSNACRTPVCCGGRQCRLLGWAGCGAIQEMRSEEHTSELQSLLRISYAVFCLKKKTSLNSNTTYRTHITSSAYK